MGFELLNPIHICNCNEIQQHAKEHVNVQRSIGTYTFFAKKEHDERDARRGIKKAKGCLIGWHGNLPKTMINNVTSAEHDKAQGWLHTYIEIVERKHCTMKSEECFGSRLQLMYIEIGSYSDIYYTYSKITWLMWNLLSIIKGWIEGVCDLEVKKLKQTKWQFNRTVTWFISPNPQIE